MGLSSADMSLFSGLYRFSSTTIYDEKFKVYKRSIREVKIYQVHFPREYITYKLYCKKYYFEDPYVTTLIRKTAYVFDVLTIRVDASVRLLSVDNQVELQGKWSKTKIDLQRNHQGYAFEQYLASMDSMFENSEKLIAFVESNKMYGLFLTSLALMQGIKDVDYHKIETRNNTTVLSKFDVEEKLIEQYVLKDNMIIECFLDKGSSQYELLWIG